MACQAVARRFDGEIGPPSRQTLRRGIFRGAKNGLAGTRTRDQRLKRALLYQLSYQPTTIRAAKRSDESPLAQGIFNSPKTRSADGKPCFIDEFAAYLRLDGALETLG